MEASGHGHSLVYSVSVGMFSVRLTTRWYHVSCSGSFGTSALSVSLRTYLRSPSIQANGRDLMPPFACILGERRYVLSETDNALVPCVLFRVLCECACKLLALETHNGDELAGVLDVPQQFS